MGNNQLVFLTVFLLIFLFGGKSLPAHDTTLLSQYRNEPLKERSFDDKKWKSLTKNLNYSTKEIKKEESKDTNWNFPSISPETAKLLQLLLKILFYTLVLSLLVFLIYKIVGGGLRFKNFKVNKAGPQNLEEAEENLKESDLTVFLHQALEKKDYRLAVRIQYLLLIRELSQGNLIRWRKEKTNYEYLSEMRAHEGFGLFSKLTLAYEYVWYGERNITEAEYERLGSKFSEFKH